jgi:hypothetical protein
LGALLPHGREVNKQRFIGDKQQFQTFGAAVVRTMKYALMRWAKGVEEARKICRILV